jgi:hypothetical protein
VGVLACNTVVPHSALEYRPPAPETVLWPAAQPGPALPATLQTGVGRRLTRGLFRGTRNRVVHGINLKANSGEGFRTPALWRTVVGRAGPAFESLPRRNRGLEGRTFGRARPMGILGPRTARVVASAGGGAR